MKVKSLILQVVFWIFLATCPPLSAAPFRIVVLGDSILSGQGQCDEQKIHKLVANSLQDCLGLGPFEFTHLARSGAIIGEASQIASNSWLTTNGQVDYGEIPDAYPTVRRQCQDFTNNPATVDLVIVDGGANDVGGNDILNPLVPAAEISTRITNYCYLRMTNLLEDVSAKFKNATIVVTGYYPLVSGDGSPVEVDHVVGVFGYYPLVSGDGSPANIATVLIGAFLGMPSVITPDMHETMVAKSALWAADSAVMIKRAVEEANTRNRNFSDRANRVVFADPRFGPENALLASQTWLYALSLPLLWPQDCPSVITARRSTCAQRYPFPHTNYPSCERASAFHPNQQGEQAYADAVFAAYLNTSGLVWVQFGASCDPSQRCGTKWNPFGNLDGGRIGVPDGGTILIKAGSTTETITINKSCRLQAHGGSVTIGR